jgi:hypothetical protein
MGAPESLQLLIAVVGVGISVVIWISSKRVARARYQRALQSSWNDFNLAALESEENLEAAEWLNNLDSDGDPPDLRRVRFMTYLVLNAIQASYLGERAGVVDQVYTEQNVEHLLPPIVLRDELFQLTQSQGYHPAFSLECRLLRAKLQNNSAT